MRYIVGVTGDERGREAIALALALAQTPEAQLDLVHVLTGPAPEAASSASERAYQQYLAGNAGVWLDKALALVPQDVAAEKHLRFADSFAEGLIQAADELGASLIVVGASSKGLFKRFTVGTVANALLHASHVPVALAPSGYRPPRYLTRMTCALGTRPGAETLLDVAVEAAALRHVPLRLISLVTLDAGHRRQDSREIEKWAQGHAKLALDRALAGVAQRTLVTSAVAGGHSIEEAIERLDWDDSEIVLIGSSRLAARSRIFLGTTANKMLRALPVPMVVVPRDHAKLDAQPGQPVDG
ncbi:universal stress family domain-containing protein [Arthrobacter crystallopoietes BAB-32]|uniref:Universal stress family domain-containing protein n=1 Tax=Arthrobacter crystallopoietes BAB-32 TaxID=1246476 RepID=N1VAB1_9MICC|nr:universal stress protein [Arthrobacter crystallopoietes]EMY35223.1 universal stress family domain-containing protein [Arthrobacter crystallopoietes BAB-32]